MFVADKNAAVLQSGRSKVNRGSFILFSRVTGTDTLLLTVEVPYRIISRIIVVKKLLHFHSC